MLDYFNYKQNLWQEYNELINRYAPQNYGYSVNIRYLSIDLHTSTWDSVGGTLSYWDKNLNQLNWRIYENVTLFQNSPAVAQVRSDPNIETVQNFTATLKLPEPPKPNELIMFYDDPSNMVYKITDVRFHRTIEDNLHLYECDFETAPVRAADIYENFNVISHQIYNPFNYKLFDFDEWLEKYQPILDEIKQLTRDVNQYFDEKNECYQICEFNDEIKNLIECSIQRAVTNFKIPFGICENCQPASENSDANVLLEKIKILKEMLC